ncbi:MAG: hypothetical protein GF329_22140 [Candidatus Lokiarchaeota archaeon]|nr:hypothetical protein [Candidatus Lokiarchaeota archaeon]
MTIMSEKNNLILLEFEDSITIIIINRPQKLNALNKAVKLELIRILDQIKENNEIKAIILTGAGKKSFIAGDDIGEFDDRKKEDFLLLQDLTLKIENLNKPIIASINGFALGGGAEIALACDFRIASENARFGFPEIKLGLIPGSGGTQRLPRLIGISRAKKLILFGEMIDSKTALNYGLVDEVVKYEELKEITIKLAKKLTNKSILAIKSAKESINYAINLNLENGLKKELDMVWELKNSDESKKRVHDFLSKKR